MENMYNILYILIIISTITKIKYFSIYIHIIKNKYYKKYIHNKYLLKFIHHHLTYILAI